MQRQTVTENVNLGNIGNYIPFESTKQFGTQILEISKTSEK
jgi:hypothetical protein